MYRILAAALLGMMLAAPGVARAGAPAAWAYMAWWMPDSWRDAPLQRLERLLFFELPVTAAGKIEERHGWPEQWEDLRSSARGHGVPVDLTLTLLEHDTFKAAFSSPQAVRQLLGEATELARHPDVAGLHLDFEVYQKLDDATLGRFRGFVRSLSRELRSLEPARQLSVFLPLGGESELYDRDTLRDVDHAVMQAYDAHWTGSAHAGPVAPLRGPEAVTWEKAAARANALGMPAGRTLLGFPLFGYEWRVKGAGARSAAIGPGQTTTFAPVSPQLLPRIRLNARERVALYGARHDPQSGSSSYRFRDADGHFVEGWFEDWWSVQQRAEFLRQRGLRGMAFFVLGYDEHALLRHYLDQPSARSGAAP